MSYESMILSFNPIAYWPLDEVSGSTFRDISGNSFDGTIGSNISINETPLSPLSTPSMELTNDVGIGLSIPPINGSFGYDVFVDSTHYEQYSPWIFMWTKLPPHASVEYLFAINNFAVAFNGPNGEFLQGISQVSESGWTTPVPQVHDNGVHFIAFRGINTQNRGPVHGTGFNVYVDGVNHGFVDIPGGYPGNIWGTSSLAGSILNFPGGGGGFGIVGGFVSHVAVFPYNTTFTDMDILRLYNNAAQLDFEFLPTDWLVENNRVDYEKLLPENSCPVVAPRVTIHSGTQVSSLEQSSGSLPGQPDYVQGFYYRIPVGTTYFQGQLLPKYNTSLGDLYSSILYPQGDTYDGYMLVKTLEPISSVPGDVTPLLSADVASEIQRLFQTLFAM